MIEIKKLSEEIQLLKDVFIANVYPNNETSGQNDQSALEMRARKEIEENR